MEVVVVINLFSELIIAFPEKDQFKMFNIIELINRTDRALLVKQTSEIFDSFN